MARTTFALDDEFLAQLKQRAAREGRPMQDLANDLLRLGLTRTGRAQAYRTRLKGWRAELQQGVDVLDRDALIDLMERS
jgi:plasmid stability protein